MPHSLAVFWCSLLAATVGFFLAARRMRGALPSWVGSLYQLVVVGAFLFATLMNVRLYIQGSVTGNSDAYTGFGLAQALINPLHFIIPSWWVTAVLGPLWAERVHMNSAVALMPMGLWETMIIDLILGSAFYGVLTWFVKRSMLIKDA